MKDHPDDPNASRFRLPSYLISSNQIDLALADLFGPATTASRRDLLRFIFLMRIILKKFILSKAKKLLIILATDWVQQDS